ncbi:MAG: phosphoribosylaminoimidazolesuccinocarboxamide synthase [Pseudobdellovibrionaceae bacterium]
MKGDLLYEGKAKKIYSIPGNHHDVLVEYKNSLTAFNALKKGEFEGKGQINREITSLIFQYLKKNGVASHWLRDVGPTEMVVEKVNIIPLEVVVRNILAGSTAKKLGIEEGKKLRKPLVEFYYKNDALADPFLSDDQVLMLEISSEQEIKELKAKALQINELMRDVFRQAGIELVDFKIEFGKNLKGEIILADEISPDSCRLWDLKTQEKLDKDRFRRDLGNIKESYEEVLKRLKEVIHG